MTITLELTPEQESHLMHRAYALGLQPNEYLLQLIDEPLKLETAGERLRRLGILGGVAGKARADGKPWSEIEGFG